MKTKKTYAKPELKPISMLEVGAATCCRSGIFKCTKAMRLGNGKANRFNQAS